MSDAIKSIKDIILEHQDMIKYMVGASEIKFINSNEEFSPTTVVVPINTSSGHVDVGIDLKDFADPDKEIKRISKQISDANKVLAIQKNRLVLSNFLEKAPKEKIEETKLLVDNLEKSIVILKIQKINGFL
jgi:valyl-tRNA synthetase